MNTSSTFRIAGAARRLGVLALGIILLGATGARADSLQAGQNVVDLIEEADVIIHGQVVEVTDGIEKGIPFTQVKVTVTEALRGSVGTSYTFRQFGLLKPRSMGNGLVNYTVSPAGWATYRPNEEVVLFLWPRASKTGLRTTVGLEHGKFSIVAGSAVNQGGNLGMFEDVAVDTSLLDTNDKRMLGTKKGGVNAQSFLSFLRRAVKDQWIEKGKMRNAKK